MPNQPFTVLLVEDNLSHAKLIRRYLEDARQPFRVHHVETLKAASEAVKEIRPRVILLDLTLPDCDVPSQTIDTALEFASGRPVVVLTSMSDLDFAIEAVNLGAQDYIVKGDLSTDGLVRALNYAVRRNQLLRDLKRSNQELLHFAFVVAHELKSPLTQMMLATERLKTSIGEALPDEALGWIDDNLAGTRDIAELVSELLSFAQVSPESDIEPIMLSDLVERIKNGLSEAIRSARAEVDVESDGQFLGNTILTSNILSNLVGNAIKYSGDRRPEIKLAIRDVEEGWEIRVADNGEGIDPQEFDQIFSLFARSQSVGDRPGLGIGLAFCKQAIEKLGGRMWVESERGVGSTFYFTIRRPAELDA